jgi:hypothetical protein
VNERVRSYTSASKRSLENAGMPVAISLVLWGLIGSAIYYFL